jgi:2'-5' RNA ligase
VEESDLGMALTPTTARLFVAVWPPQPAVDRLEDLPRPADAPVRWVAVDDWHITLRFVGEADPREIAERLDHARLPAVTAELGPAVSLLGPSAVVVPVRGLDPLAHAVRDATAGIGEDDLRPFTGHLTLGRAAGRSRWTPPATPVVAAFDVKRLALVRSTRSSEASSYETIGEWLTTDE